VTGINETRVIIIGGGIGGLTTALALKQKGIEVEIYEKAKKFHPIGIALGVLHNGASVLKKLGIQHKLAEQGEVFKSFKVTTSDGKSLYEMPLDKLDKMFGVESVALLRSDLHDFLLSAASDVPIHYDYKLESYQANEHEVVARFANGKEVHGSVLVGADGIRSVVRQIMLGDKPPRSVGTWWGGITEANDILEKGCFSMVMGKGAMANYFPLADGKTLYAFSGETDEIARDFAASVVREVDQGRRISKAELTTSFGGWAEPVSALVDRIDEDSLIRWDVFDRPTTKHWVVGRVALLGDSAHAMVPTLGQGANQTMEDAIFLADSLNRINDPVRALKNYERRRKFRAQFIVSCANGLTKLGTSQNRVVCGMRDLFMRFAPNLVLKSFIWIKGFPEKSLTKNII